MQIKLERHVSVIVHDGVCGSVEDWYEVDGRLYVQCAVALVVYVLGKVGARVQYARLSAV